MSMRKDDTSSERGEYVLKPKRRRRWRWLALIFVALLVSAHWFWGWTAERKLLALRQELADAGEPAWFRDLGPTDAKDAENAARPLQAAAQMIDTTAPAWKLFSELTIELPLNEKELALVREVVAANAEALSWVRRARGRPKAAWQTSSHRPPVHYQSAPEFGLLELRELLTGAVAAAFHTGDHAAALERVRDLLAVSRASASAPGYAGYGRSVGLSESAADCVLQIAPDLKVFPLGSADVHAAPRELVLDLIAELLDERHARDGVRRHLQEQRLALLDAAEQWAEGRLGINDVVHRCGNPLPWQMNGYLSKPIALSDGRLLARRATRAIDAIGEESWPACARRLPTWGDIREWSAWHVPARVLAPDYESVARRHFHAVAERRMAAVLLAIKLYEAEHGAPPRRLSQLVPAHLPSVPDDPFARDARPLGYVPDGEAGAIVYSVGHDGADDTGSRTLVPPSTLETAGRWQRRDSVMHLRRQPRQFVNDFLETDEQSPQ